MIKLVDNTVPAIPPTLQVRSPSGGAAGEPFDFKAEVTSPEAPVLAVRWDFGDGTIDEGINVNHTYTHAGTFQVIATATGVDSVTNSQMSTVTISGEIPTRFDPSKNRRAE
jgi:PKD repeat protein